MATRDSIPTTPATGAYVGRCWVLPARDPAQVADAINEVMQQRCVGVHDDGTSMFLAATGLPLLDRQIIVTLTHGGQANLYVCDSMEVNQ